MGSHRNNEEAEAGPSQQGQGVTERRALRSRYHSVKNLISEEREDITRPDSEKFKSIINEVESLHHLVQRPREQVADAEALLDIATTLVTSVRAHGADGITPSDFITCLHRDYGQQGGASSSTDDGRSSVVWKDIGFAVSHVFRRAAGCCTMTGPLDIELKQQKVAVHTKYIRPSESSRPDEIIDNPEKERTDTDKNMATIFDILRKSRKVRLENLVLNRKSFAQTVENLFALSFLVKDGRAEVTVNENGSHLVSPRNAPAANVVLSGEVSYNHFVFRFDFKDWKFMIEMVRVGEELMPHRNGVNPSIISEADSISDEFQESATTPIRKFSRNCGLVLQEQAVVKNSPIGRSGSLQNRKRQLGHR